MIQCDTVQKVGVMNLLWRMIAYRAQVNLGHFFVAKIVIFCSFVARIVPFVCLFAILLKAAGLPARWCFKAQQWSRASPNLFASESTSITPSPSMIPYLWHPPHHEDIDVYNGFAIVKVICFLSINVPEFWSHWLPVITPCSSEDEDEALLLKCAEAGLKRTQGLIIIFLNTQYTETGDISNLLSNVFIL